MKSNSKHKAFALTKKGVALPVTAALLALIALFGMTACPNSAGGNTDSASGGNTGGLAWHEAPFIEGGASLILSPDKLTIRVTVTTSDNSPVTVEGCDKTELTSGTQTELKAKGRKVVLKGKITKLTVGDWQNPNKLTALNVQGLSSLQELDCNSNKLTALNVQGLSALEKLNCWINQLTELNVQGLNALHTLHCGANQLTELNVQGLSALQSLGCYTNQLSSLNVQGLNALQDLICSGNQLTALNVQGLNALKHLDCSSNQLTALNVQGLNALKYLFCIDNKLTSLNVQGLNALQKLNCRNNQLTALNVQGLNALQELYCSSNQLTSDAFIKLFNDLPQRTANAGAQCYLYTERSGVIEGNHRDFTSPGELKTAFDNAKNVKHWKMYKQTTGLNGVEI